MISVEPIIVALKKIVRQLARRYATDGLDPDDLEQEAYVTVIESCRTIEAAVLMVCAISGTEPPKVLVPKPADFIPKIRHRLFILHRQVTETQPEMVSLDEPIGADEDGATLTRHDVIGADATQHEALESALAIAEISHLPSEVQDVLWLRAEGFTFPEISRFLNKNENTVKSMWFRARERVLGGES